MPGNIETICAQEIEELESIVADWSAFSPQAIQRMLQWLISFYAEVHAFHIPEARHDLVAQERDRVLNEAQGNVGGLPEHPESVQPSVSD